MKKIISLLLILVMCLCLSACTASGNTGSKEYNQAISNLKVLLNSKIQDEDLQDIDTLLKRWGKMSNNTFSGGLPLQIHYAQDTLEELYNQFVSLDEIGQSKEILDRFSIVENGKVVVNRVVVDFAGNERITENIDTHILDELGRKVATYFRVDGSGGVCYAYDNKGNLIRKNDTIYFYNEDGLCTEAYSVYDGPVCDITTYTYDENGNCIEETQKGADGFINVLITYRYDENGNCVEETYTYSDGSTSSTTYLYDAFGNRIEATNGNITTTYVNIYDEENNLLIVLTKHETSTNPTFYFSIYNKSGILIEERDTGEADITVTDFQYENGLPVRVDFSNGMAYTYTYSPACFFDAAGLVLPEE